MKIKKDTEYAVIGLLSLISENSCSVKYIADKNNISVSFLAKIFQKLSKAHIVKSRYGPGGGYTLAKSANKITFYDILLAVQPKEIHNIISFKNNLKKTPKTYLHKIIIESNKKIINDFKKITLKHFMFYFLSN